MKRYLAVLLTLILLVFCAAGTSAIADQTTRIDYAVSLGLFNAEGLIRDLGVTADLGIPYSDEFISPYIVLSNESNSTAIVSLSCRIDGGDESTWDACAIDAHSESTFWLSWLNALINSSVGTHTAVFYDAGTKICEFRYSMFQSQSAPSTPTGDYGYVTASNYVSLRKTASTKSGVIVRIPARETVTLIEKSSSDMWFVEYLGVRGYVNADYLKVTGDAGKNRGKSVAYVISNNSVLMRSGPGVSNKTISGGHLSAGTGVIKTGVAQYGWVKILYPTDKGILEGWVPDSYLRK